MCRGDYTETRRIPLQQTSEKSIQGGISGIEVSGEFGMCMKTTIIIEYNYSTKCLEMFAAESENMVMLHVMI